MIEQSIKHIVSFLNGFEGAWRLDISDTDHFVLQLVGEEEDKKLFESSSEMLEWCENNLKQR